MAVISGLSSGNPNKKSDMREVWNNQFSGRSNLVLESYAIIKPPWIFLNQIM